jgi:hypothetical protein
MGVGRGFIARDLVVFELRSTGKVRSDLAASAVLLAATHLGRAPRATLGPATERRRQQAERDEAAQGVQSRRRVVGLSTQNERHEDKNILFPICIIALSSDAARSDRETSGRCIKFACHRLCLLVSPCSPIVKSIL